MNNGPYTDHDAQEYRPDGPEVLHLRPAHGAL